MRKGIQFVRGGFTLLSLLAVMLYALPALAQNTITIRGTVTDKNKDALLGVSVRVDGTSKGASTDVDGKFTLVGVPSRGRLVISFTGMKTLYIPVNGKTSFDIVMQEDDKLLDELVVVAYGKAKKVNLTGAVSSLDSKAIEARPVATVSHALQGLIPGLNLTVGNSGGALNSRLNINIRGTGTIGAGSNSGPLILIDGVEGDMNTLSANDIENISVLKDASSSSIYGSRAAFGVILITTKSGREGKTRVSYNGNVRFSTATQVPDMMDSEMFANYFNRAAQNSGSSPVFNAEIMEKIKKFKAGSRDEKIKFGTDWNAKDREWSLYSRAWANTNWFEEFYQKNAPSHEHNLSISGGTNRLKYYLSGALLDQRGILKPSKDEFQRYNFSAKISANVASWLMVNYQSRFTREDYERPSYLTGLFFHNIARRWPTNPYYDPFGYLMPHNEANQIINGGRDKNQKDFYNQQLTAIITPLDGLTIRLEQNYNTVVNYNHWDVQTIYNHDKNGNPVETKWDDGRISNYTEVGESSYKTNFFSGRYFAEYAKIFADKHDIKVTAGLDMDISRSRNLSGTKKHLITPLVPTINTATSDKPGLSGGYSHWSTMGVFARVNYAFDSRYLFEFSVRRDGSSRFIGDKTWATFPSFSLGWNAASEAFWEPLRGTISQFKLRGSWGQLGNTNIQALYPWFLSMPFTPASTTSGSSWLLNGSRQTISSAPGLVSNSLTWERVESWNIGLDFSAFKTRLQGSFDFYNRNTRDMVGPSEPITSLLGAGRPPVNNSDLKSYGWELELRWRDQIGDLRYGAKFVLSDSQVEITKFYNPTGALNKWYVGRKMGEIWGYETVGIAKTDQEMTEHLKHSKPSWGNNWAAGDIMYRNFNPGTGEKQDMVVSGGNFTLEDHGDLRIIGNSSPRYSYSFTADASYKGIDFSIMLQGVGKRDFYDSSPYFAGANHGQWQSAGFKEHWDFFRPEGDPLGANLNAYYPRVAFGSAGKNFQTQTRFLQDASYMRIKNVQLGYTIPRHLVEGLGVNGLRVYTSVDNLATFTSLSKIFDPEATGGDWGPGKIYPLQRVWSLGLNLNF